MSQRGNRVDHDSARFAPTDLGSDDFQVRKFSSTTTHSANAVPAGWAGKWVTIAVQGGTAGTDVLHYGFSTSSTAEIDRSVAATAAGASAKVGDVIPTGQKEDVLLPFTSTQQTLYFVRESTATLDVYVGLKDEQS